MDVDVSFWIASQIPSRSDGNATTLGYVYPLDPSDSYNHLVI